ncbi:MAG: 3-methyl-2-oxobutanoate hydroxymethyltransferase [Anaerolineae bacterium]|nr:3-methyl-2-oxobutanoate hydroxymethyltransferase [Anaerolineae bacterium]MCB9108862.1 3-methyl-2-oxobutanoate hydroxymethyltransferase [Anaerolineales bacterium]
MSKKVSILDLQQKKVEQKPITMLTAYDYPGAKLVDEAGIDMILVGDSLAMTVLGHPDTVSVTMDEMLHHCKAVARGAERAFLVGDMPFMSYQVDRSEAVRNAGRLMKEGRMDAIKLEGGREVVDTVRAIVNAGIPVVGHLGLTPQTATKLGGFKVQAKTAEAAKRLIDDALALQDAGCFAIVLEAIPAPIAEAVSKKLAIPTIGIGAGVGCDGQVLVFHDVLGLYDRFTPKFVKRFAELRQPIIDAFSAYREEVESRAFPTEAHSFKISEAELRQLNGHVSKELQLTGGE